MKEQAAITPVLRVLLGAACFVIVVAGMKAADSLLQPALLALVVSMVTWPAVRFLARLKIPGPLAIGAGIAMQIAVVAGIGLLATASVRVMTKELPTFRDSLAAMENRAAAVLEPLGVSLPANGAEWFDLDSLVTAAASAFDTASLLSLAVLMSSFLLLDLWSGRLHWLASNRFMVLMKLDIAHYLRIKLGTSLLTGVLAGVVCAVAGLAAPVLLGLIAGVLNFIPLVGSIIAAVPAVLLAGLTQGWLVATLVAAGYMAVNLAIGNILEPRLLGRATQLSALTVVLTVVFWAWVLGPVGAVVSVPITAGLKLAATRSPDWLWLARLLGEPDSVGETTSNESSGSAPEDDCE